MTQDSQFLLLVLRSLKLSQPNLNQDSAVESRSNLIDRQSPFDTSRPPGISISSYITRLNNHFSCSENCHISALLYLDIIVKSRREYQISVFNLHKLYLTALVLSIKFHEDFYYTNEYCAMVGGISCEEMNKLEREMLMLLDYRLCISSAQYTRYLEAMRLYFEKVASADSISWEGYR